MTKISVTQWGNYSIAFAYLFKYGVEIEYITPPPITKKTLEIGSKHSPDYVCSPFKFTIGSLIEALENGADTLCQVGGECRLGYYGELQEQIIKDLGYEFDFLNLSSLDFSKTLDVYKHLKRFNPNINIKNLTSALLTAFKMVEAIDEIEDLVRKNIGFEVNDGEMEKLEADFINELKDIVKKSEIKDIVSKYKYLIKKVELDKPKNLIKVGIVGEYYTIMEPFSNHFMEKELAKKGIVVDRWINITNTILKNTSKKQKEAIKGYAKYNMGATSMMTIYKALEFAKDGYDGIVHIKSFGCTPEIDAMPVLQKISRDFKIPILYFSFDSQTSETGIQTRLEAFHDMILMRKENKK